MFSSTSLNKKATEAESNQHDSDLNFGEARLLSPTFHDEEEKSHADFFNPILNPTTVATQQITSSLPQTSTESVPTSVLNQANPIPTKIAYLLPIQNSIYFQPPVFPILPLMPMGFLFSAMWYNQQPMA